MKKIELLEAFNPHQRSTFARLDGMIDFNNHTPKVFGVHFLKDFLIMNKAWKKFIHNFHTVRKINGFDEIFEYMILTKDIHDIIKYAFVWAETKEGGNFWFKLDNLFQIYLDTKESQGYDARKVCYDPSVLHINKTKAKGNIQVKKAKPTKKFNGKNWVNALGNFMESFSPFGRCSYKKQILKLNVPLSASTFHEIKITK